MRGRLQEEKVSSESLACKVSFGVFSVQNLPGILQRGRGLALLKKLFFSLLLRSTLMLLLEK